MGQHIKNSEFLTLDDKSVTLLVEETDLFQSTGLRCLVSSIEQLLAEVNKLIKCYQNSFIIIS